jgi:hypothetical protein
MRVPPAIANWTPTRAELVRETIASLLASIVLSRSPALIDAARSAVTGSIAEVRWSALIPRSPNVWLITILFTVLIFAILRAIDTSNKVGRKSSLAHDAAIIGGAMENEVQPSSDKHQSDDNDETDETPALRPGFVERFGMIWYLNHVPKKVSGLGALVLSINAMASAMGDLELRVEGPYCPNDYERLQLKDVNGYRHMNDGDDVNWVGSPYCAKCGYNERPDPNYRAPMLLSGYRTMVKEEFER